MLTFSEKFLPGMRLKLIDSYCHMEYLVISPLVLGRAVYDLLQSDSQYAQDIDRINANKEPIVVVVCLLDGCILTGLESEFIRVEKE